MLAVPGITAAAGICAELGIPMTHRGVATAVRFLTGHSREGEEAEAALAEAVAAAADPHTTLVVYMGLGTLPQLVARLSAHGMPLGTPAVAVERGTTIDQRVAFADLEGLQEASTTHSLRSPTLLIIGQVVSLAPGWAEWDAAGRPRELFAAAGAGGGAWCARGALPDAAEAVLGAQLLPAASAAAAGERADVGGGPPKRRREGAGTGAGAAAQAV